MKKHSKADKFFLLTWKRFAIAIFSWIVAVVLHNVIYAFTGVEEAVFFTIATIVIPLWVIIALIYTLFKKRR